MLKSECSIGMPVILNSVANTFDRYDRHWYGIVNDLLTENDDRVEVSYGSNELIMTNAANLTKYKKIKINI